jgi:hypothetical protein
VANYTPTGGFIRAHVCACLICANSAGIRDRPLPHCTQGHERQDTCRQGRASKHERDHGELKQNIIYQKEVGGKLRPGTLENCAKRELFPN